MQKVIEIPENLKVEVSDSKVSVTGEKGSLEKAFNLHSFPGLKIEKKDNKIVISSDSDRRKVKAMVGTIYAHIRNMMNGVTDGYTYKMKIVYVHFPMTVKVSGNKVIIENFLGENKNRTAEILDGVNVEVKGEDVIVTGINKESVGQTCANIERATKVSYRDRRTFQDGIFLVSK